MRLLSDLIELSLADMHDDKHKYYYHKFKFRENREENTRIEKILNTIKGVYNYVASIYGEADVPKDLDTVCKQAKAKRENYGQRKQETKSGQDAMLNQ
jgi:hypothetical protein